MQGQVITACLPAGPASAASSCADVAGCMAPLPPLPSRDLCTRGLLEPAVGRLPCFFATPGSRGPAVCSELGAGPRRAPLGGLCMRLLPFLLTPHFESC